MATTISTNIPVHSETRVPSHPRDLSPISSGTTYTNTTMHSQLAEPLLRPTTPKAGQHYDVPPRRLRSSEKSLGLPRWSHSHITSSRHSAVTISEKGFKSPLKRVKLLRWIKNTLSILMGKFSLYLYHCLELDTIWTSYLHLLNIINDDHFQRFGLSLILSDTLWPSVFTARPLDRPFLSP